MSQAMLIARQRPFRKIRRSLLKLSAAKPT
jgi:hypothetical protein